MAVFFLMIAQEWFERMDVEELNLNHRAYNALKNAGIDSVEDLCLLTQDQILRLTNVGKKSVDEVRTALEQRSLSLNAGPADPRLLLSTVKLRPRFNLGLSIARRDRESLARHTLRDLAEIMNQLENIKSRLDDGRTRNQLLAALTYLGLLRRVHETVLAGSGSDITPRSDAEQVEN